MQKALRERKEIYDAWHRELYQADINGSYKRSKDLHDTILDLFPQNLKSAKEGSLLDVACGKGLFLKDAAGRLPSFKLYGTDISDEALSRAKKIVPTASFKTADAEDLPYRSGYFDIVTCLGGLEYFPNPLQSVEEIKRVLIPGGTAIFFVPNLMFIGYIWLAMRSGAMPTHGGSSGGKTYYNFLNERFFTLSGWSTILSQGGLKVRQVYRYDNLGSTKYAHPFFLAFYKTILSKLVPKTLAYCYVFNCRK